MVRAVRLVIVDDDDDMRTLLRLLLRRTDDIELVAEADSREGLDNVLAAIEADVVLIDHGLPGMSGATLAHELRQERPGLGVLLFSAHVDDALRKKAEEAGVSVVGKDRLSELPAVIRSLAG